MSIKWPGCNFVIIFRFLTHDTMLCPFLETLPVPPELSVISGSQIFKVFSVCAKRTVVHFEESTLFQSENDFILGSSEQQAPSSSLQLLALWASHFTSLCLPAFPCL